MKELIYEDFIGPLPPPPIRFENKGKSLFMQVFIRGEWLSIARRNRRKREWSPLFWNLDIEEKAGGKLAITVIGTEGRDERRIYLFGFLVIFQEVLDNVAAYIAGWLDRLGEDNQLVVRAASKSQKAADWILNRQYAESAVGIEVPSPGPCHARSVNVCV
jgi:hypothetical protein